MKVLLLTATVDPGQTPVVTFRDPAERLVHYYAATLLWARSGWFDAIVLCENTGNGDRFAGLRDAPKGNSTLLQVLSFDGNEGAWEFGKGYGEGRILEHAFEHSKVLARADEIWKSTGRIFVRNCPELRALHRDDGFAMGRQDTRFYKIGRTFFQTYLEDAYRGVNDHAGVSIEVAYDRILSGLEGRVPFGWIREPRQYVGQDAGSGNWHEHFPAETLDEARGLVHRS